MHPLLLPGIVLAGVLLQASIAVYRVLTSPTRSIPGPTAARFTRLWYLNRARKGGLHRDNIALHEQHGPIVRLAPGWYSISMPDKTVYGIGSKFRKSDWYKGWNFPDDSRWSIFSLQDVRRHGEERKRFQSIYSLSSLVTYEPYVDEGNQIFFDRLAAIAQSGEVIDMAHWFQCYAFDVMGLITYSKRFGFLDGGHDVGGLIAALDQANIFSALAGIYDRIYPYLAAILAKMPGTGAAGLKYLMAFVEDRIRTRSEKRAKKTKQLHVDDDKSGHPKDFLDKLSDAHEKDPAKVTDYHIFMMGMSNIIAGSDTTAVSLSSVLKHLITNPDVMAKLRKETAAAQASAGPGYIPFKTTNTDMPYLQAVIKEALRLHPATGFPLWRVVPEGGAVVAGQRFEAGDVVGVNSWVAHYDKTVYGEDVHLFRPERWLEADEERTRQMEANYMPFGLGSRTCIGRHISHLEMSKLIPGLVNRFDFELAMPVTAWKEYNYWFVKPERLPVRVIARKSMS